MRGVVWRITEAGRIVYKCNFSTTYGVAATAVVWSIVIRDWVNSLAQRSIMKKVLSVFAFCAMSAMAADFTGYIMDTKCAHQGDHGASDDHAACAARCIKGGDPAVLVTSDGKVYKIADQDKVVAHAGHKVTIYGHHGRRHDQSR